MSPRALLASAWTLVILALCWIPSHLLRVKESGPRPFLFAHIDKLVHFSLFAGFAFLWARVGRPRAGLVLAAGVALAILTELGQELPIVGRDADVLDGLADAIGVAVGLLAFEAIRRGGGKPEI